MKGPFVLQSYLIWQYNVTAAFLICYAECVFIGYLLSGQKTELLLNGKHKKKVQLQNRILLQNAHSIKLGCNHMFHGAKLNFLFKSS